jgi:hypothetical protein
MNISQLTRSAGFLDMIAVLVVAAIVLLIIFVISPLLHPPFGH